MAIKQRFFISLGGLLAILPLAAAGFQGWEKNPATLSPAQNWQAVLPHPEEPQKALLASSREIFEFTQGDKSAGKKMTSLPDPNGRILRLHAFPSFAGKVFILTENRLYTQSLGTAEVKIIFESRKMGEKLQAFSINEKNQKSWLLGTSVGLYESSDAGNSWRPFPGFQKDSICVLGHASGQTLIGTPQEIFISSGDRSFKKTFSLPEKEFAGDETASEDFLEEVASKPDTCGIRDLFFSVKAKKLWLATEQGVYESGLQREPWKKLSSGGLISESIQRLSYSENKNQLLAASDEELYLFQPDNNRWESFGDPASSPIRAFAVSGDGQSLFAATSQAFLTFPLPDQVRLAPQALDTDKLLLLRQLLQLEPSAMEIHRAVVRYANAKNGKINRWQAESRLRALLPSFSFSKDFSRGNNIDIDRAGTNERDVFIEGPADRDWGWDASVSWDLGDLIFNSSQTSIDSREKLMVELRHDLTQEATRLFYERRRLQSEILFLPSVDQQEHLDRLLRVEELTSLLDNLTNGFMSKRLEEIYGEYPELEKLWAWDETNQREQITNDHEDSSSKA